jgi:hypothetical protein
MIVDFTVENYRSIRDEQTFSFASTRGNEHPDNLLKSSGDMKLLKCAVIYGPNASGKSNFIKALYDLCDFIGSSDNYREKDKIPHYHPFKLDKQFLNEPSKFEIEFILEDEIRYNYSVKYDSTKILEEYLYYYPKKQKTKLFHRVFGQDLDYGDALKGPKKSIEMFLSDNILFLSKAGSIKDHQLRKVYEYFLKKITISRAMDTINLPFQYLHTNREVFRDEETKKQVIRFLKFADVGIESIKVKKKEKPTNIEFQEDMPQQVKDKILFDFSLKTYTVHKQKDGNDWNKIDFELKEESDGTIKLYSLASKIVNALEQGNVLVIDELNNGLHPNITMNIVKLFQNTSTNQHSAQLLMTTHDTTLLGICDFRRDQIWFIEKDENYSSHIYSLAEFKYDEVRPNIPIDKWYLSGRFGAVPLIQKY